MNPIEQAFAASLNGGLPHQGGASSQGQAARRPIHGDRALCEYILSTVQAPEGSLSIQESTIPNAGSGLFTTRDLAEGELIFTSVPLVLCAEVGEGTEACDFCFQQRRRVFHPAEDRFLAPGEILPALEVCNGCRMYQYCSRSCWQRAWDTGHLYECGLLAGAATEVETRTLYRLLILLRKKVLLPDQAGALARLANEVAGFERRAKKTWPKVQGIAREAKERTKSELDLADILKLYCIVSANVRGSKLTSRVRVELTRRPRLQIRVNSLPIDQTYRNAPLGSALDLAGSLLNHCCDPNVVVVFNSTQVQVRALTSLKAGEELLHCYRDLSYDFTFRNPRIASRYQFRCRCTSSAPHPAPVLPSAVGMLTRRKHASGARCGAESDRHHNEAKSDADILPLILSTQAALFDVIDDAKKQAFASPCRFDIAQQLSKVEGIVKTGYAGLSWPSNLEPLPTVLKALAALCERQGDLVNSVRIRIKALANTRYRRGLPWSEDLIDLVLSLSTFTMFPGHPALRDRTLPRNKDFQDVFIGHLHALHAMLVNFYGEQGRVTKIVRSFLQRETSSYYGPMPATRAFRRKFKASQETILKWAGVDERLWPVE
ncbi:hypothetical protein Trco_005651 [Trichoderma cornu-damae]|uniref:Suppressor of anucleate metulae protein B n=1 Tax=Trichoderma cornu-damae TaxID=654480 RepID=A0A9P8QNV2_9HYPO|nr:hypothetical protein Trco_005651 [Trichoderma cornu-damae]